MFGLMLKSTHEAAMEEMQAIVLDRDDELIASRLTIMALKSELGRVKGDLSVSCLNVRGVDATASAYRALYFKSVETLNSIAAQETPSANATVKRMANMAREALPKTTVPASNGVAVQH
jgi:hypothetical protein